MTAGYLNFNRNTSKGKQLGDALQKLKDGRQALNDLVAQMAQMIDGDSSDPASYVLMQTLFLTTDNASAKALFDELNADLAQLNSVKAAIDQLFAKTS